MILNYFLDNIDLETFFNPFSTAEDVLRNCDKL